MDPQYNSDYYRYSDDRSPVEVDTDDDNLFSLVLEREQLSTLRDKPHTLQTYDDNLSPEAEHFLGKKIDRFIRKNNLLYVILLVIVFVLYYIYMTFFRL